MMLQNKKQEAIDYIMAQLDDGYIDLGLYDENEIEVIRKAVDMYIRIHEIIQELEELKMFMEGQIFYSVSSKLAYIEIINKAINEVIRSVKQLLSD